MSLSDKCYPIGDCPTGACLLDAIAVQLIVAAREIVYICTDSILHRGKLKKNPHMA